MCGVPADDFMNFADNWISFCWLENKQAFHERRKEKWVNIEW